MNNQTYNNQEQYNNYGTKKSYDIGIAPIKTEDEIKEENNIL